MFIFTERFLHPACPQAPKITYSRRSTQTDSSTPRARWILQI